MDGGARRAFLVKVQFVHVGFSPTGHARVASVALRIQLDTVGRMLRMFFVSLYTMSTVIENQIVFVLEAAERPAREAMMHNRWGKTPLESESRVAGIKMRIAYA